MPRLHSRKSPKSSGFTIVELLVVIVVIGILAAITIVSYTGITNKATLTSLTSDLDNASKQLKMYYVDHGAYPTGLDGSNCPTGSAPSPDTKYCLKASSGNTLAYSSIVPSTFHLTDTNGNNSYAVTNATAPAIATTANGSTVGSACPSGFIPVPGSGTYGTNDFCVMKYEAKNVGGVATSQAALTPWVNISETTAITNSQNVANCTGCHLISEAEWLTIAQNVLSVNTNWSGSTVGTGCIFRGNAGELNACSYDGADPEFGTGRNAKASLTLSNGQVIWDLAGNVWEYTSGTSTTGQPGITGTGGNWREWTAVTNPGTISPNPSASATGITGASGWNSGNGVGQIYSNTEETGLRGFPRGGAWGGGSCAGVLALALDFGPDNTDTTIGFRVSR